MSLFEPRPSRLTEKEITVINHKLEMRDACVGVLQLPENLKLLVQKIIEECNIVPGIAVESIFCELEFSLPTPEQYTKYRLSLYGLDKSIPILLDLPEAYCLLMHPTCIQIDGPITTYHLVVNYPNYE